MTLRPSGLYTPQNIPFDPQHDTMRHEMAPMAVGARPVAMQPASRRLDASTPMTIRYVDMQGNEYKGDARAVFQNAVTHQ